MFVRVTQFPLCGEKLRFVKTWAIGLQTCREVGSPLPAMRMRLPGQKKGPSAPLNRYLSIATIDQPRKWTTYEVNDQVAQRNEGEARSKAKLYKSSHSQAYHLFLSNWWQPVSHTSLPTARHPAMSYLLLIWGWIKAGCRWATRVGVNLRNQYKEQM